MPAIDQKYYGVYSNDAASRYGTIFWTSDNDSPVEIIGVSNSPDAEEYLWEDKIIVGEVLEYSHKGRRGVIYDACY